MSDGAITRLSLADAGEIYTLQLAAYVSQGRLHEDYRIPPLVQTFEELVEELANPDVIALGIHRRPGRRHSAPLCTDGVRRGSSRERRSV